MNLLRRAAETVMSVAVIVVFGGLLAVTDVEQRDAAEPISAGEQAA